MFIRRLATVICLPFGPMKLAFDQHSSELLLARPPHISGAQAEVSLSFSVELVEQFQTSKSVSVSVAVRLCCFLFKLFVLVAGNGLLERLVSETCQVNQTKFPSLTG